MTELRTYRSLAHNTEPTSATGGYDATTWTYHPQRGWLTAKEYPDGQDSGTARDPGPSYTYTAAGRLAKRIWARGNITRHLYDAGFQTKILYFTSGTAPTVVDTATSGNDPDTPDITVVYDQFGRPDLSSTAIAVHDYAYDSNLFLDTETITIDPDGAGPIPSFTRVLDHAVDALRRDGGYEVKNGGTTETSSTLHYHPVHGRLLGVAGDTFTNLPSKPYAWEYQWQTGSDHLIDTLAGPTHTDDYEWDSTRDLLLSKTTTRTVGGSSMLAKNTYTLNAIGQRTAVSAEGTVEETFYGGTGLPTSTDWKYDALGQVVSQDRSNGTAHDRGYKFDAIGNRTRLVNGTADPDAPYPGTATSQIAYTPNALNQIDQIASNNGTPASFSFDLDGNMIAGRVLVSNTGQLSWNGENRLVQSKPSATGNPTRYAYDAGGRRVAKMRYDTSGNLLAATAYLYDDWNMVAEYNLSGGSWQFARGYIWGLDLSNTLQGAGGVGGLLGVRVTSAGAATGPAGNFHPTCDGNGNIEAYVTATGSLQAVFQYDAFGNHFTSSATPATTTAQNHFFHRFSSKYQDAETRYLYYGYRYYDPATGRWPSRDPIEERGGVNLYGFADNNGVNAWDRLGLHKQDKWYGFNNKQFHKWFHRCWKEEGDPDAEKEEVERAYRRWIELGKAGPEAERCYDKDECKREDEQNEPELGTGHEPENAPIPDETIPALPPPPKWLLDPPVLPDLPDGAPPIINPPPIIDFPGDRISEEEAKVIRDTVVGTVVVGGCVYLVVVTGGAAAPAIALVPLACGAH